MAFEFKLPDIGEGVVEGEIVEWLVAEGEEVTEDQPLVAVMTDKATVEIPSPKAGKVVSLGAKAGDTVPVGSVLVTIDAEGGDRGSLMLLDREAGELFIEVATGLSERGRRLRLPPRPSRRRRSVPSRRSRRPRPDRHPRRSRRPRRRPGPVRSWPRRRRASAPASSAWTSPP